MRSLMTFSPAFRRLPRLISVPTHTKPMNKLPTPHILATILIILLSVAIARQAAAVEALLLQDTYVDNGTTGGKPPPNASNYGGGMDLRIFKGNGRIGRIFLKFSLATLPPGTLATDISSAPL